MANRAGGDAGEERSPVIDLRGTPRGHVRRRLEVVEQVKLFEIDQAPGSGAMRDTVPVPVGSRARDRRCFDRIDRAVEHHARRCHDTLQVDGRRDQIGIGRSPHLGVERADQELADGNRAALREERFDAQIRLTPTTFAVLNVVAPVRVIDPNEILRGQLRRLPDRERRHAPEAPRSSRRRAFLQAQAEEVRRVSLSGRVKTSPPKPAEPRGRLWQPAQESTIPAPIEGSSWMFSQSDVTTAEALSREELSA